MSFEDISFRNLVEFYRWDLRHLKKLTGWKRSSLLKKGVLCISRIGRSRHDTKVVLSPRAISVLKEIDEGAE